MTTNPLGVRISASVQEAHIQNAAITRAKIAELAVDEARIVDLAVTAGKIVEAFSVGISSRWFSAPSVGQTFAAYARRGSCSIRR